MPKNTAIVKIHAKVGIYGTKMWGRVVSYIPGDNFVVVYISKKRFPNAVRSLWGARVISHIYASTRLSKRGATLLLFFRMLFLCPRIAFNLDSTEDEFTEIMLDVFKMKRDDEDKSYALVYMSAERRANAKSHR